MENDQIKLSLKNGSSFNTLLAIEDERKLLKSE
jgi:hypothetical protein